MFTSCNVALVGEAVKTGLNMTSSSCGYHTLQSILAGFSALNTGHTQAGLLVRSVRRSIISIACIVFAIQPSIAAEQEHLRDPMKEGGKTWEWHTFYHAVLIVRGSIDETSKERPDLSIHGQYSAWSKLTAPSLAKTPTENGFYLLNTRVNVQEVLYADPTMIHLDANINWLIKGRTNSANCVLGAELRQVGEPDENGTFKFVYRLRDLDGDEEIAKKDMILVLGYLDIYPIQSLYLKSYTSTDHLEYVRRVAAHRNQMNFPEK